jgi:hypothetical protein
MPNRMVPGSLAHVLQQRGGCDAAPAFGRGRSLREEARVKEGKEDRLRASSSGVLAAAAVVTGEPSDAMRGMRGVGSGVEWSSQQPAASNQ